MQIVTDEPLLECRVLASCVGPNREEAIKAAMAAAGVTELVEGPRPQGVLCYEERTNGIQRIAVGQGLKSCLAILEEAMDGLIGALGYDRLN